MICRCVAIQMQTGCKCLCIYLAGKHIHALINTGDTCTHSGTGTHIHRYRKAQPCVSLSLFVCVCLSLSAYTQSMFQSCTCALPISAPSLLRLAIDFLSLAQTPVPLHVFTSAGCNGGDARLPMRDVRAAMVLAAKTPRPQCSENGVSSILSRQ